MKRASSPHTATRIGRWLGVAFGLCFVTGLLSHHLQHPPGWFAWPTRPVDLYRVTQGVHVTAGVAAVPLLLAKLWTVYPKLFERPVVRSLPHALERGALFVLLGASFFELVTGLFNAAQNYPWRFFFPTAHHAVAWVAVGALLVHVAVKLPLMRTPAEQVRRGTLSRRGFLLTAGGAAAVGVLATAGGTVPWLRTVSVLGARSVGLPVNRTAAAAGVSAVDDGWRLVVGTRRFSRRELEALPQTTAELPIACVEGWSASARWTGVPVRDLLALAGVEPGDVRVESLERDGLYRASTLPAAHARDPSTLLALRVDGATLPLDHGYPCRLIAPSRPGVTQTKWVTRLEVIR
ncbi:molybdopterin-dependent oxidoreductase-like protein [Saccharothrix saharensis]|uniref:Molybdopterin-dependent oxidoreductase-like protein n=1 Tax=Saccharothrix saharensis TaxID=571190 RepID=A0A543JEL3_9PSEU|nr:molybdopterin-dependent oxidoreductase-like protein [Saccharothrix saharensis]